MRNRHYRKLTIKCKECKAIFTETNPEEIAKLVYIFNNGEMRCPVCGGEVNYGIYGIINPKQEELII